MSTWKVVLSTIAISTAALAGPTLACHQWTSTPGSAFEILEPLRDAAMYTANHRDEWNAGVARIAKLRADIRRDDPATLLKAGYWIAIMNELRLTSDSDGPELIRQAASLRPNDADYEFFAALAYFDNDKQEYRKHWARAVELAKPESAASRNLKAFEPELALRMKPRS
jgi:hypothetical protein